MRPKVVEGNPIKVGIRLGSARDVMTRKDNMSAIKSSRTCGELAKALFVATVHILQIDKGSGDGGDCSFLRMARSFMYQVPDFLSDNPSWS